MIIDKQIVNINDLFSDKYMHKEIKKNIFLSDYQIEILLKYNINPYNCNSINDIIYNIEEVLNETFDAEDLENISYEISEFNYYSNTNK